MNLQCFELNKIIKGRARNIYQFIVVEISVQRK